MRAAYVESCNADSPLEGLRVGGIELPPAPEGWVPVAVESASLNHHDLWSLKGVGLPPDRLPMVLGTDAAGIAPDGSRVVVHAVVGRPVGPDEDETLDPGRTLLSELHPGTLAEKVWVPPRNLIPVPAELTLSEAACLPTAYLTAWRMLRRDSGLGPGSTVLVQGSRGGVATALIQLARLLRLTVWATSRTDAGREHALAVGAHDVFASGARLPERVDAVMENVGEATWEHSLKALRPGGTVVVCGATSGANPPADLNRVFFRQLRIVGSTMGTVGEFRRLIEVLVRSEVRPVVAQTVALEDVGRGLAALDAGEISGKVVVEL